MNNLAPIPDGWVYIQLPSWVWGGKPEKLFQAAKLVHKSNGNGWNVRAADSYHRRRSHFLQATRVTNCTGSIDRHTLASLGSRVDESQFIEPSTLRDRYEKANSNRRSPLVALQYLSVQMQTAQADRLPDATTAMLEFFRESARFDDGEVAFPHADIYLIKPDEALALRLKISAILLRFQHDPRLAAGSTKHLKEELNAGGLLFRSGDSLMSGYTFGDTYLAPLLACLSPFVWGMMTVRSSGIIVSSFGRSITGTLGDASELLQTVPLRGPTEPRFNPGLSAQIIDSGIEWWVERISRLWGLVGDMENFRDSRGAFDAQAHFNAAITIENCFRSLVTVLTADRDGVAREFAFHAYIDTYEKLTGRNSVDLLSPQSIDKVLTRLESDLPADSHDMLLHAARRARKALSQLGDGFYLLDPLPESTLTISGGGSTKRLSRDSATARLIRALRNSKHGVGGKSRTDRENASLLAQHDGAVPHDLGLLAWLLHLKLLSDVDNVVNRLSHPQV